MSTSKGMRLSNIEVKRMNRNSILQYMLQADAVSKNMIAEDIHLSIPTVTQSLNELKMLGLVREEGTFESIGGRKAMSYHGVKDAKVSLGIDITANHINIVIIDLAKQILYSKRERIRLHDTRKSYDELKNVILTALAESQISPEKILGMGVSLPAIVDETGSKVYARHEQMEISYDLYNIVNGWFDFPISLANDANSAGMAEIVFSKTKNDTVYMFVSQTVGGAIINNGQVFYGKSCRGGEFGHMTLYPGGKDCFCGRKGCVNAYCSTKVLSDHSDEDLSKYFEELTQGNKSYLNIWDEYLDHLALAIHDLNMAFDSEIIIGGYLGQYITPYMDDLRKRVRKIDTFLTDTSFIKSAKLQYEAAAIGAASVFVKKYVDSI